MNQTNIEKLINLNKIRTRDLKSRRELWKDKIYYLENNPYWDKNIYKNLPMPSTFHRIQQELKKVVAKQEKEVKNANCHILEHSSDYLVFVFFPDPPVFENLKEFLWTTGNNVWYETEKWDRTRLHVVVYAKKEKILSYYMKWLCSAWQGVVHNSPLLTTTAPLIPWGLTNYDEVCMCPSVLNASKHMEFTFKLPFKYALWGERKITQAEDENLRAIGDDEFTQRLIRNSLITLREEDEVKAEMFNFNFYEPWEEVRLGNHDWRFFLIHDIENNENNIPESSKSIQLPLNEWRNEIDLGNWLEQMELIKKYSHFAKHISFQFWWKGKPVSQSYSLTDLDLNKMLFIAIGNPTGIIYQIKSGRVNVFWRENCSYTYSANTLVQAKTDMLKELLIAGLSGTAAVITGGGSLALTGMATSAAGAVASYQKRVMSSLLDGSKLGMEQINAWEFSLNWKEPLLTMKLEFNNQQFNQYKRERAFKINGNKWETTDAVAKIINHPGYYKLIAFTSEWDTSDKFFNNLFSEGVNLYKDNPRENFNPDLLPSFTEVENLEVNYSRNVAVTVVDFTDTKVEGQDEDVEYDERSWILQKSFLKDTVTGKDYLPELVKSRPKTGGEINPKKSTLLTKYPEDIWNPNGDYMQAYCDRDIPAHSGGYEGRETKTTYKHYRLGSYDTTSDTYETTDYNNVISSETKTHSGTRDVFSNRKGNYEKTGTENYSHTYQDIKYGKKMTTTTKYHYSTYYEGESDSPKPGYQSIWFDPTTGYVSYSPVNYRGVSYEKTTVISEGIYRERTFAKPAAWKFGGQNQWRSEPIELTKGHQHSCAIYGWSSEGGNGQEKLIFQAEESGDADAWTATLIQNGATWTIEFNKATYITEVKKTVDAWTEKDQEAYLELRKEWQKQQEEQQIKPDFFDTTVDQLKPQADLKLKEQEDKAQEEFEEYLRQQETIRAKHQEQLRQRQKEAEAEEKKAREQLASRSRSKRNWRNISLKFTEELQQQWEELGFSYEQAQDWINTGFKVSDVEFVAWLVENGIEQETVLNELSSEDLNQLYQSFESEKKDDKSRRKLKNKDKNNDGEREN